MERKEPNIPQIRKGYPWEMEEVQVTNIDKGVMWSNNE